MDGLAWHVAHTRPRREKKLKDYCEDKHFVAVLPCFASERKYRRKTVVFQKPLFPGYVFLRILASQRQAIAQNEHVARLLTVFDQELFERQLQDILKALETGLEIRVAPEIYAGHRVKITRGALQGIEAWVQERQGMMMVLLRLDFIGQAAAVKLPADHLERI
jgi:transcription antitermination factor NusG